MSEQPLLIEIGVEEIPAGVAPNMGQALHDAVSKLLADANVLPEHLKLGVTPRRLVLHAPYCASMQADREEIVWGPPEAVAFKDGVATPAATGFARKNGMQVDDFSLADKGDGKARYMRASKHIAGRKVVDMLAEAMPGMLNDLPSPKRMQWQDGDTRSDAFIRPVRWMVARLGSDVIPFSFAGVASGVMSFGHRIHGSSGEMDVHDPWCWLQQQYVVVDREVRKGLIEQQLSEAATQQGVELVEDAELLEEVVDLVEWPCVIAGQYDADYLRLPEQVARIVLKNHQRCFTSRNSDGSVSHVFFTVANIASKRPASVAEGNAKVVNARLADAAFYFDRDPSESLEQRICNLGHTVFQEGLGSVADQVARLAGIAAAIAPIWNVDAKTASRAARLCKSDLTTGLVYEFAELQGYMGGIYARMDGEAQDVADAIAQHYQPEGAEGELPSSDAACLIGVAERLDKLLGYFHLGRVPTASADPFALRRSAIALLRLLMERNVDVNLSLLMQESCKQWQAQGVLVSDDTVATLTGFIYERLHGMTESLGVQRQALSAALASAAERSVAQDVAVARLLTSFTASETGQAVAAANKRIANILKKVDGGIGSVNAAHFVEPAEKALYAALQQAETSFPDAADAQLETLAGLRDAVDAFFDGVMVMAEDATLKQNRLALLARLRTLFLRLADISYLG